MATHRLDIDQQIGWFGIDAQTINEQFKGYADDDTIDVHINSGGGDVFDGIAIFNRLDQHLGQVNVFVDGLAASAASVIAMGGDTITISRGAMMMIHGASGFTMGNAETHREQAELLEKINGQIVDIYAQRTGMDQSKIVEMMDAETWMDDAEARDMGFADEQTNEEAVVANFDLSNYRHVPKRFAALAVKPPTKEPHDMKLQDFQKAATDNPDWVAEHREAGIKAGVADGRKELRNEFKAMLEAAGDDHKLACESFMAGVQVETVEAVAKDRAERIDATTEAATDQSVGTAAEIAKIKLQINELSGEDAIEVDASASIVDEDSKDAKKKARVTDGARRITNKSARDQYIRAEGFDPADFPQE